MAMTDETRKFIDDGGLDRGMSRGSLLKFAAAGLVGASTLGRSGFLFRETDARAGRLASQAGATFVFGEPLDAVSLDPINSNDDTSNAIIYQCFDGLVRVNPSGSGVLPALAESVPAPTHGGRVYTFKLRDGIKFHDGTTCDANAVAFNINRWRESKNQYHTGGGAGGSNFSLYTLLMGGFDKDSIIQDVKVLSPLVIQLTLKQPYGPFLTNMANVSFSIASPQAIQKNVANFWQQPVGTGPFQFTSWQRGSAVTLTGNPSWWGHSLPPSPGGGGPFVNSLIFQDIPDSTARVAALVAGQLNGMTGLAPSDVKAILANKGLTVIYDPPLEEGHVAINMRKKPLGDLRVRQAIAHAINVPLIVKTFFGNTGIRATSVMPSGLDYFDKAIRGYSYNPALAKKLLAQAGYGQGFKTTLWYLPIARPYMPAPKSVAQVMQSELAKVGIKASLVTYDFGTYLDKLGRGEHDLALIGGSTGGSTDPDFQLNYRFNSKGITAIAASNQSYYRNPKVDKLLASARVTTNSKRRQALYYEVQKILAHDVPIIPIAYVKTPIALQKAVHGIITTSAGQRFNTARID